MRRKPLTGRDHVPDRPSRTQKKKAADASQKVGEQLLALTDAQLESLDLPSELREAVTGMRKMESHGARRRQLQYIGSLMRHIDSVQLKTELDRIAVQDGHAARCFKIAEQWRDELASGDQTRAEWLLARFSTIDKDRFMRLVDDMRKNATTADRRRAGRALFRYLRQFADLWSA